MAGRVLITGASTGMGRRSALYLSERGYEVFAASRTPKRLEDIANARLHPVGMDLRERQSVDRAVADIGRVDVLVNNAGYGLVGAVEHLDDDEMKAQFEINLFGLLRVTRAVIPSMRERGGGVIVNISSFLGKIGLPLLTLYNASKYAVEGVTDSLRYELAPFHIRVHSILPGFFDTEFARSNLVCNRTTFDESSPYRPFAKKLAPRIVEEINGGNDAMQIAKLIEYLIETPDAPARMTAGEKSKKFIPMRRELSDEDFERRVKAYYEL
ncbi:SDR family oxidoreductase [Hydrogenimonas sp. SS33]|uniref:SDR family oxidoreductase n=1 Tax=Hydrogenimonas leucolamina TaxID=2954236 RepID=UPI00336BDBDD